MCERLEVSAVLGSYNGQKTDNLPAGLKAATS